MLDNKFRLVDIKCQNIFDRLDPRRAMASINQIQQNVDMLSERFSMSMSTMIKDSNRDLLILSSRLDASSPRAALQRGYCFLRNEEGVLIQSIENVKIEDLVSIHISDGEIKSEVKELISKGIGGVNDQ